MLDVLVPRLAHFVDRSITKRETCKASVKKDISSIEIFERVVLFSYLYADHRGTNKLQKLFNELK